MWTCTFRRSWAKVFRANKAPFNSRTLIYRTVSSWVHNPWAPKSCCKRCSIRLRHFRLLQNLPGTSACHSELCRQGVARLLATDSHEAATEPQTFGPSRGQKYLPVGLALTAVTRTQQASKQNLKKKIGGTDTPGQRYFLMYKKASRKTLTNTGRTHGRKDGRTDGKTKTVV